MGAFSSKERALHNFMGHYSNGLTNGKISKISVYYGLDGNDSATIIDHKENMCYAYTGIAQEVKDNLKLIKII